VHAETADGGHEALPADVVLIATGATPRILDDARPDGERILTWRQLYDLTELPEHLVVVGSGVTGAEFVSAYVEMGARVTLVSSRDRVLPGEDADAAAVCRTCSPTAASRSSPGPGRLGPPRGRRRRRHPVRRAHRSPVRTR
jgi:pyruvate/2-oxoglutarate dehydrogenase complex dihydrolipoamide dehydrogenase (E3) component